MRAQNREPRGWFSAARRAAADDTGASLVIALIVITVVAVVAGSTLLFSDTGIRTTVALRGQANDGYAADSAAQVAVDKLRTASPVDPTFGCTSGLLSNMQYPASATAPGGSATVTCAIDNTNSQTGFLTNPNSGPGSALLSLGTSASDGITIDFAQTPVRNVTVDGGVFSNTFLNVPNNPLQSLWTRPVGAPATSKSWIIARKSLSTPASTACPNVITNAGMVDVNCNYGSPIDIRGIDPGLLVAGTSYNQTAPSGAGAPVIAGSCSTDKTTWVVQISPPVGQSTARFTAPPVFPSPANPCKNNADQLVIFNPATYYFDFATPTVWSAPAVYYVGGTLLAPLSISNPGAVITSMKSDVGSACVGPLDSGATANSGVEFFFSANSSMAVDASGNGDGLQMALCGNSSSSGPPIVVYSQRTVTSTTSTISSANCPKCMVAFKGTIYTPSRPLNVLMNNASTKGFAYGIYAKSINININSSAKGSGGISLAGGIPEGGGSPIPVNYLVLKTYVCPGQFSCTPSGAARLISKVLVSGYIQRTVAVISWSAQR